MKYERCKCGNYQTWGSGISSPICTPCSKCGSIPAGGPFLHPDPQPHDYIQTIVQSDDGKHVLSICRHCNKRKIDIEKAAAKVQDVPATEL